MYIISILLTVLIITNSSTNYHSCDIIITDINVTLSSNDFNGQLKDYIYFTDIAETIGNTHSLCIYVFTIMEPFDLEVKSHYQLNVTAIDTSGQTSVAMVIVNVLSVNEHCPMFTEHIV